MIFEETQINFLKPIMRETVRLEQTADIIIPDSMADIDRVVDASGTPMIRSADCTGSSVSVEGMVQTGVLFVDENGKVQPVTAQIPFSVRRDTPQEGKLQCICRLMSVDARMLNSRKILVRVGVSCELRVLAPAEQTCYDITEPAPNLQLKRLTLPLTVPMAVGEKGFTLHEELEIGGELPPIGRLMKSVYRTQIAEQKIVGDKAVFKGGVQVQLVYEGEDGTLYRCERHIPFSQYARLEKELEEAQAHTDMRIVSAELEADPLSRRLLLAIELMAQCTAYGKQEMTVIEDAFCTDSELTAEYTRCNIEGILDRQVLRETMTAGNDTPCKGIVDACVYFDTPQQQRNDDGVLLECTAACNVLYYDENGALQGKTLHPSVSSRLALAPNAVCRVVQLDGGEVFCGSGTIEVRMPLAITAECAAEQAVQMVCGAQITERSEAEGRRPSLILRRTEDDEELWQIAKTYRTSVQTILQANELQNEQLAAGAMLLIPMT